MAGLLQHNWGVSSLSWGSSKWLKLLHGSLLFDSGAGEGLWDVKDLQWILFHHANKTGISLKFGSQLRRKKKSFMGKSDLVPVVGVHFWTASLASGSRASWHPLEPGMQMASFIFPLFNRTAKWENFSFLLAVDIVFLIFWLPEINLEKRITNNYEVSIQVNWLLYQVHQISIAPFDFSSCSVREAVGMFTKWHLEPFQGSGCVPVTNWMMTHLQRKPCRVFFSLSALVICQFVTRRAGNRFLTFLNLREPFVNHLPCNQLQ